MSAAGAHLGPCARGSRHATRESRCRIDLELRKTPDNKMRKGGRCRCACNSACNIASSVSKKAWLASSPVRAAGELHHLRSPRIHGKQLQNVSWPLDSPGLHKEERIQHLHAYSAPAFVALPTSTSPSCGDWGFHSLLLCCSVFRLY